MKTKTTQSLRKPARGKIRSVGPHALRTSWFAWDDPETGERLEIELWGSQAFLQELESIGFERLGESELSELGEEAV